MTVEDFRRMFNSTRSFEVEVCSMHTRFRVDINLLQAGPYAAAKLVIEKMEWQCREELEELKTELLRKYK